MASVALSWLTSEGELQSKIRAGVGVLGGSALAFTLYKLNDIKTKHFYPISPEAKKIIQKSHLYALGSVAIASVPIATVGALGRTAVASVYTSIFTSGWTTVLALAGAAALCIMTVVYPKDKDPALKRGLWVTSSALVGGLCAPFVFLPPSFLSLVGGYTLSLAVPLSIATLFANNLLVLNIGAVFGMIFSSVIFKTEVLPKLFHRYSLNSILSYALLAAVVSSGLTLLITMNTIVRGTENAVEDAKGRMVPKEKGFGIDRLDPISNGFTIFLATLYVFLKLVWSAAKVLLKKKKKESR